MIFFPKNFEFFFKSKIFSETKIPLDIAFDYEINEKLIIYFGSFSRILEYFIQQTFFCFWIVWVT